MNIIRYLFFLSLRENLLTKEIEDLKSKLTDELNEPIELNSEVILMCMHAGFFIMHAAVFSTYAYIRA